MPPRLLDIHAPRHDVSDTLVVAVDTEPDALRAALRSHDLVAPVAMALHALGLGSRIVRPPSVIERTPDEVVLAVVLGRPGERRLGGWPGPGRLAITWDVRVEPGGLEGAYLSSTRRFTAGDEAVRRALFARWAPVNGVAAGIARRTLTTLDRLADVDAPSPALRRAA
jgi:hypothetical protein